MVYLIGRYFAYAVVLINSSCVAITLEIFARILEMRVSIGLMYTLYSGCNEWFGWMMVLLLLDIVRWGKAKSLQGKKIDGEASNL
jgi:hypothetical protein